MGHDGARNILKLCCAVLACLVGCAKPPESMGLPEVLEAIRACNARTGSFETDYVATISSSSGDTRQRGHMAWNAGDEPIASTRPADAKPPRWPEAMVGMLLIQMVAVPALAADPLDLLDPATVRLVGTARLDGETCWLLEGAPAKNTRTQRRVDAVTLTDVQIELPAREGLSDAPAPATQRAGGVPKVAIAVAVADGIARRVEMTDFAGVGALRIVCRKVRLGPKARR